MLFFNYVAGNKLIYALEKSKYLLKINRIPIINYINENKENALENFKEYTNLINKLDSLNLIALKLSSFDFNKKLIDNVISSAVNNNIKIIIDAEDNKNIDKYRLLTNELIYKYNTYKPFIYKTYQMYRTDSYNELNDDTNFFYKNNKILATKLVRGAYYNAEKNEGHLFNYKGLTDNNYNYAIKYCFNNNLNYNIIACHNTDSILLACNLNKKKKIFKIANLMGMNESFMNKIKTEYNIELATYIPYGPYNNMLPYLTRRLYENLDQIKFFIK
jgi:proline dehydrogenase